MLQFRRYQSEDNAIVKELHYAGLKQFGSSADPFYDADLDNIENVYINNRGDFLVGLLDNEIVAMGAIRKFSDTCGEIKRIRVRQNCQRRGYGRAILSKLIDLAKKLGYSELCLDTVANNLPAQRLFEQFDFKETHRAKVGPYDIIFYGRSIK